MLRSRMPLVVAFLALLVVGPSAIEWQPAAAQAGGARPLRGLYVTGGGFHDFVAHEKILPPAVAKTVAPNARTDRRPTALATRSQ